MVYSSQDTYSKKAKAEGYPSRSAFKLKHIQSKFRVIKSGDSVLDLGAAPGGWSQVALEIVGKSGRVVAVDLQPVIIPKKPNFTYYSGDIKDPSTLDHLLNKIGKFNVTLSDMAPFTTGVQKLDQAVCLELARAALSFSILVLEKNGNFIAKFFQGPNDKELEKEAKVFFKGVHLYKPAASRKESKETYLVCRGKQ